MWFNRNVNLFSSQVDGGLLPRLLNEAGHELGLFFFISPDYRDKEEAVEKRNP